MIKKGDKFLLIDHRGNSWNSAGEMDCYISKIVTVSGGFDCNFSIKEDNKSVGSWVFDKYDISKVIDI